MTGVLIAAWLLLCAGMFIVAVWTRASEWTLLDLLKTDAPEIFATLGHPTIHEQWPLARLDREERALIRDRSVGPRLAAAHGDYETAIKVRRVAYAVAVVSAIALVEIG